MKVLFCKTSYMKYYKGAGPWDVPQNGGSYVEKYGWGHEEYNFEPVELEDGFYLLGFVETKSTSSGHVNDLHLEKIAGCQLLKKAPAVDDVLVIWCATDARGTLVVGWYQHATVFRQYQEAEFENGYIQGYNVLARKEDCVLLPHDKRNWNGWHVPLAKKKHYGFGQALVWYPTEKEAQEYLQRVTAAIAAYDGENWIDQYPDRDEYL